MLDEFAKLMTDAAGVAQGARREVETVMRAQGERLLSTMDLVQRDEFEAVREMASAARLENEKLRAELDALKAKFDKPSAKKAPTAKSKTASKTASRATPKAAKGAAK
jgi:BMFP domain-containing protein YqiC